MKTKLLPTLVLMIVFIRLTAQTAVFTYQTPACSTDTIQFIPAATAGTILQESWDFGDGGTGIFLPPTSFPVNATHKYSTAGVFTVMRTVVFTTGTLVYSLPVLVQPPPVSNFTYSGACFDSVFHFTDYSTAFYGHIDQWIWNFGDGSPLLVITFPLNPNVSHTYSGTAVTHYVTLTTISNAGCSHSITLPVTQPPSPLANFSWSDSYCLSDPVSFTDLSQSNGGNNIVGWNWNFDDPASGMSNTSSIQNPTHTFSVAGIYDVMLVVLNAGNCSDTVTKQVVVPRLPDISGPSSVCLGDVSIHSTAAGMSNYTWNVTPGGIIIDGAGTSNVKIEWTTTGSKNVSVSFTPACGTVLTAPGSMAVIVGNVPPAAISPQNINVTAGQVVCAAAGQTITLAGNGSFYTVYPGGHADHVAGNSIHFLPGVTAITGSYLHARIAGGCTNCPVLKNSDVSVTSIHGTATTISNGPDFWIYPNPTSGTCRIQSSQTLPGRINVQCYNSLGRMVFEQDFDSIAEAEISLAGQQSGIYHIKLFVNDKIHTIKTIKY